MAAPKKSGVVTFKDFQVWRLFRRARMGERKSRPPSLVCSRGARARRVLKQRMRAPSQTTTQTDDYLEKLQPLVAALAAEVPDAKYDAKSIGNTIAQLMQLQEDALGLNVRAVEKRAAGAMCHCKAAIQSD